MLAPLSNFASSEKERRWLLCALYMSVVLALLGCFFWSFNFEVSGFVTQFLFGANAMESYSLFSIGVSVANGRVNETGLLGLSIVFVLLAVLVPSVLLGCLFTLWLVPMQLERQRALLHACRLLDAWACFDVAGLALVIAYFQFGKMAKWLVYEGNFAAPCNMVRDITKGECMSIELHALPAMTAVVLGGVLMVAVPKVCLRKFDSAIQRRFESLAKAGVSNSETSGAL